MLARYKIYRGKRPETEPLPAGIRQDTRKHTRHCLRPTAAMVSDFLDKPCDAAGLEFEAEYQRLLHERYQQNPAPFDELAGLAREQNVFLGCSCPTKKNPDVNRCHTVLALRFMQQQYPELDIELP